MSIRVEFCGEFYQPIEGEVFVIGREGDLVVDENAYLHRRFLEISNQEGFWWIANVGSQLPATVSDASGSAISWLTPGGRLPVVFAETVIRFTAGSTSYEINVEIDGPVFAATRPTEEESGETTIGRVDFRGEQRILILALAESVLRKAPGQLSQIPSRGEVAQRLGWSMKKLDRKLDAVCQKLHRSKVRGVYGSMDQLASNRRARVVEFAVSSGLVTQADLVDLDNYLTEDD